MKVKKIISALLIIAIMIGLMPAHIYAANTVKFSITPSVTEAHPGDEITYTVKMSAIQNMAGLKFKLIIPEGLTFIEGKEVDGIQTTLNAAKAEFTSSTKVFVVGSSNYSSDTDTTLMTFKCSVDSDAIGDKEITFSIDEDDVFDTTTDMNNIPVDYSNPGSKVTITPKPIPSTGISLNTTEISLENGTNQTLVAKIEPEETTDTIIWESDDESIATVDENGKITAVGIGTAIITVKTTSGYTATCTVTVTKPVCKHLNKTTIPEKEPTCTIAGNNEYKVCDDCGMVFKADGITETTVETEKIDALGHDFSIPQKNETQHWNECSRCGIADTKINHIGEGEYGKDSINHWKVCGCGTIVEEEEHKPSEAVKENEVSATCTEEGSYDEVVYCSVCGYEMSRTSKTEEATGHTEGTPVKENEVPATCTEEGSYDEVVYCSVCGYEMSRTNKTEEATGHTEGTPVKENIVPATCTEEGSYDEVIYCTVCNTKISTTSKIIEKIPHDASASEWSSDEVNHWKECGCGTKVDISEHTEGTPVKENIVPATCTENGSYDEVIYCSVCGREMSRVSKTEEATGHTEGTPVKENIVPATCTEDGSYDEVIYCSECGYEMSRTSKIEEATGHTEGVPVKEDEIPATCTEEGTYNEVIYCTICNTEISSTSKTIPAKGHTEGVAVRENEVEATEEKEGSYEEVIYCSECGKELSRTEKTIPKIEEEVEIDSEIIEKDETEKIDNTEENDVKKEQTTPKTDDTSNMAMWVVGLIVSGILFVIVLGCKIKGSRRKGRHC